MNCDLENFYRFMGEVSKPLDKQEVLHLDSCNYCKDAYLEKIKENNLIKLKLKNMFRIKSEFVRNKSH